MAVLEKIRSNAKLMVGFVGLALAAFVLGDALQNGGTWFSANQRVALSVDGTEINIEDYERRLHSLTEQMQNRYGSEQLSDEQRMSINNELAQQFVATTVLNKLAQQVGLRVTPDEVYALLTADQGIAPSPQAAQFFAGFGIDIQDSKAVNDLIKQLSDKSIQAMPQEQQGQWRMIQSQWRSLQETLLSSRLHQKLQSLLSRSYKVTKLDQELALADGSRSVALVRSTPMASDSDAKPSDEEVKKYYDTHKNFFHTSEQSADLSYIAVQVVPSSDDYKAAETEAQKVYDELREAATDQLADVVRNYGGSLHQAYLTDKELDMLGLGDKELEFIKTAEVGAVHNTGLVNDKYNILRLVGKKQGISAIGLKVILLDSLMSTKSDSLLAALKGGASFDEMVEKYSQDPQTKAQAGRLTQPGQYGMVINTFSEAQLAGSPFDGVYSKPVGEPYIVDNGLSKIIIKSVEPEASTQKYQVAVVNVEANFSDKTYNGKYEKLNNILGTSKSFDEMEQKAEKEGFSIVKNQVVSTSTPQLMGIPASRQLVSWALRSDEGELTDKVYRVGTDYLLIARVNKHYEPGTLPLTQVKDQIVARLLAEKRAQTLVDKMGAKGLTSLDAYASELNTVVDTLVGVNYLVRGSEPAAFNGKAMTTAIGQLSKPFVAGTEFMVVRPMAVEPKDAAALEAQALQAEQGTGYQLASRVFQNLMQRLEVKDNRARFY